LALVDELDAALEVEAELGVLRERAARNDHEQRQHEQEGPDPEDREVAGATGHRGVSTSRSPPSSSYAGKMSAFAGSGRSPSACTTTGLSSNPTPPSHPAPVRAH